MNIKTNKMGVEPIKKLMLTMGIPMVLSMILQAFYNIVDSYFVSCIKNTGELAVNALTLSFPVQMLMVAIGVGTGVGINSVLSRSLGEGNRERAGKIAGNAIFLGFCTYIVFLLFGIFGVGIYMSSQSKDAAIIEMGKEYLGICTILSFGVTLNMIYEKLLQGCGKSVESTVAQLAGALSNIILDPILIFGYFGLPAMGIAGAAYATVAGQIITLIIAAVFYHFFNKDISSKMKYLKPDKGIIKTIYKVGFPAIIMQALMSFMTYGVNIIFGRVSANLVTSYGIYYKIQQFVFFAAFGLNNAIIPIVAFNYGKNDKKRIYDGIKYGLIYTVAIMLIGTVLLEILSEPISGAFSLSAQTKALCKNAIKIIALGYIFAGANIALQGVFQALGYAVHSLVISLLRLIIIALPLAFLFTLFQSAEYIVWWAFPIAEAVSVVPAVIFLKNITDKTIKNV